MFIKKLFLIFFCFTGLNTIVQGQHIIKLDKSKISFDSLNNKIKSLMTDARLAGLCISVFNDNKPVFTKAFGFADVPKKIPLETSTILYGASFSKAVFAYIVMQLTEEKIIDLDKPLVQYLSKPLVDYEIPGFRRGYQHLKNDERYKKITGRMCLNHTTGFPNWRWFEADEKLKIKFEPGTRYSYSGEGMSLLQFVIEQITGKDYETIAQERVFKPLGMINTSYVWQESFKGAHAFGHNAKGEPYYDFEKWEYAGASGTMCTNLDDYTKFFTAVMQQRGLKKESFNEMIRPQVRIKAKQQFGPNALIDNNDNDNIQLSYGLGFGVFVTPYGKAFFKEGHDDGWGHYSIIFPDKGVGIILMTNSDNGESTFRDLLATAIGDTFTPWYWENYIPYNQTKD